ncbi:MAG: mechanosensitive ion channel family protein [Actinobacteria bacterium]|nr:mechanosensitive ion channel family protein [Actinomycetota bacterium]
MALTNIEVLGYELPDQLSDQIGPTVATIAWLIVAWLVWKVMKRLGDRTVLQLTNRADKLTVIEATDRKQRIDTLWAAVRTLLLVLLVVIVFLGILNAWGVNTAPFLAVGSIIGIAIGFGAQDFVKDVIAGFLILAEDQYSIGDVVKINNVSGTVKEITLRSTILRDLDGNVHYVPNGSIGVASNYTQEYSQVVIDVGFGYGEDVDTVIPIIQDELDRFAADEAWTEAFIDPPEILGVQSLGDSSVTVRCLLRVTPEYRWSSRREFLRRIKARFDAEGIEIPFPYLTIAQPPRKTTPES